MCLSVYIGSHNPLDEPADLPEGGLGLAPANWCPPPLIGHAHVYTLGARHGGVLGCACLLTHRQDWDCDPPLLRPCSDAAGTGSCPFAQLRRYVTAALAGQPTAALACDANGGVPLDGVTENDYDAAVLTPSLIHSASYLFHDGPGGYAMRRFTAFHDG